MPSAARITSPTDPALDALCARLAERSAELESSQKWPGEQLAQCAAAGVFEWFLPTEWGGQAWSYPAVVQGYVRLAAACLTTTFVLTQRSAGCRRIVASEHTALQQKLLPGLANGTVLTSVGISQLTTSRQHLGKPAMAATKTDGGYLIDGSTPWVTGAAFCDVIVVGAVAADGGQLLAAVPRGTAGMTIETPPQLVALQASYTSTVRFENAFIAAEHILAGPEANVLQRGSGGGTGGLETSALALGLARAALGKLHEEAAKRPELQPIVTRLQTDFDLHYQALLALAEGQQPCTPGELRGDANSLALRATQAYLTAAKGAGFVAGHPAGRWCREALFFLVWSCPQPVSHAMLCELAQLSE